MKTNDGPQKILLEPALDATNEIKHNNVEMFTGLGRGLGTEVPPPPLENFSPHKRSYASSADGLRNNSNLSAKSLSIIATLNPFEF